MNVLNSAIYTRLQGTSAIRSLLAGTTAIYYMQAPAAQAYPYIVWNIQGGGDENMTQNRTKNLIVYIRAFATGAQGAAQAGSIDTQIDTALHLSPLTVSGWTNFWLARIQDIETVSTEPNGQLVASAGGFYRIRLQDT